jgi:fatty acid desaturase
MRSLLRHAADRRSLALAGAHFALVAMGLLLSPRGAAAVALVAVLAYSSFMQLISGHNAMHSPVFRDRGLNRAWQAVLSLTFSYPVSAFVPVHNLSHHMHLQTPKDVLRTTEVRHRSNLLNLLHHVLLSTIHIHVLNFAYLRSMRRRRAAWFAQVRGEIVAVVAYAAAIIAITPGGFLTFVLVPALLGQCMIIGLGYLQHDGCDEEDEVNHSRNFLGRALNWLIFDNGYHSIHHMKPGLHWSRLKEAHARLVAPRIHPALDQRSILAYMWRAYFAPGVRERFDGAPVRLPEAQTAPELWIPASARLAGAATGAVED